MFLLNYAEKFIKMREVGKYTTQCLDELTEFIQPGITSNQINEFVKNFGTQHELENAQLGYKGFPAYCCTSLNEIMCHGIPNDDIIEAGVLSVDITFKKAGYHGDACRTYLIGKVPIEARNFVTVAENALTVGIQQCGPEQSMGSIGKAIEAYATHNKVYIAKDFIGHGIGLTFHESPGVCHVEDRNDLYYFLKMTPGMTFTIEPIVCMKSARYRTMKDGWGIRQKEKKLSAQFEATIGITEDRYEVFCQ